jgi:hypothetical protein
MIRRPRVYVSLTSRRDVRTVLALACVLFAALPAHAAKWRQCPGGSGWYPSELGAVTSAFVHPSHDVGIFLLDNEVRTTGGFSTAPEGNRVTVTFASLFGDPIVLPSSMVAAVSRATLFFTFPDTLAVLGEALAGPVDIEVRTDGVRTAHILPRHLVALPAANDVGTMVLGGLHQSARATMDTRGSIWIPVQFSAFGTMQKEMPHCSMPLTPLTALAVGLSVRSTPVVGLGSAASYPPFRALRNMDLYLGDFLVNGTNIYGLRVGTVPVLRIQRGWGIKVCGVNDAVDLVLKARGWRRWAQPWSPFGAWMPNSRPLDIELQQIAADQVLGFTAGGVDAFGEVCTLK